MMTNNKVDAVEIIPKVAANASIIWMHGLGASGDDFLPIVDQFKLPSTINIRFIFPNAPIRSVTINNGMKMRAWYDITDFDDFIHSGKLNHHGITESQCIINNLIEREINHGINPKRIVLAGFSQGGALALHTGLRLNQQIAGIVCLSGYLPWDNFLIKDMAVANRSTQIFMAHGLFDPVVPINLAKRSYDTLANLNYNVLWNTYSMQHTVVDKEIIDLENFFIKILG